MRHQWKWRGAAIGVGAAALAAPVWGAPVASAATVAVAVWNMDETSGTRMLDSSGHGNNGTSYNVTMTGDAYLFDPAAPSKVVVADSPSLDPGKSAFSYSVVVKANKVPASGTDYDLLRKGISSTSGGEYKLEIVYVNGQGRAFCLVKDSTGTSATVKGTTNVTDGQAHTLTCTKTSTGLTLRVDSLTPRTNTVTGGLGSITNVKPLVLGAKTPTVTGTAGDWYNGAMLRASISVG